MFITEVFFLEHKLPDDKLLTKGYGKKEKQKSAY